MGRFEREGQDQESETSDKAASPDQLTDSFLPFFSSQAVCHGHPEDCTTRTGCVLGGARAEKERGCEREGE